MSVYLSLGRQLGVHQFSDAFSLIGGTNAFASLPQSLIWLIFFPIAVFLQQDGLKVYPDFIQNRTYKRRKSTMFSRTTPRP